MTQRKRAPGNAPPRQPSPAQETAVDGNPVDPESCYRLAERLAKILAEYQVDGCFTEIHHGPVATTFEFAPASDSHDRQISNLGDELAARLGAHVRIVKPLPGRSTVGIEVSHDDHETTRDRASQTGGASNPVADQDGAPWLAIVAVGKTGAEVLKLVDAASTRDSWADPCRLVLASSDPMLLEKNPTSATRLLLRGTSGPDADPEPGQRHDLEWIENCLRGISLVMLVTDPNELDLAVEISELTRGRSALVIAFAPAGFGLLEARMERLRLAADTLVVVPTATLASPVQSETTFGVADVIAEGVLGIADSLLVHGFIGVDFADYRGIFAGHRLARMSVGLAEGSQRAEDAALRAMTSPSLSGMLVKEARCLLFVLKMGLEGALAEINDVATLIQKAAREDADMAFASVIQEGLKDLFQVVLYAMGTSQGREGA